MQADGKRLGHPRPGPMSRNRGLLFRKRALAWMLAAGVLLGSVASAGAGKAPHLTKKHPGWRQTGCASCHDAAAMAKTHADAASLGAPDCGRCHGYNGAPHEAHAVPINPCASCHSTVGHLKDFKVPDDCISCHVHPESPQGR